MGEVELRDVTKKLIINFNIVDSDFMGFIVDKELYLSGFSSSKIATLYSVDKASIIKILKSLGVKIRSNKLSINNQEFKELVQDY